MTHVNELSDLENARKAKRQTETECEAGTCNMLNSSLPT